jgi:hypothetical protein
MARKSTDDTTTTPKKPGRLAQLRETYRMAKKTDPRIGWISIGSGLLVFLAFIGLGFVVANPYITGFIGFSVGLLVTAFLFGRRAERAAYGQIEGQPGAAAAVMNSLRRGWTVTPAIAVTRQQDVVHRAVGRPGIVLVGEGVPSRVANLLANEKRRHARVAPDAPVYDVIVGEGENQVALRALTKHLTKLPRAIRPSDVTDINYRIKALGNNPLPMPKGPLPKTTRMPKSGRFQ